MTDPRRKLKTGKINIRLPGRNQIAVNKISTSSKIGTCSTCHSQKSKYTCPRCHAASCSLDCYKAHGGHCTEAFYEKQVREEMKQAKPSKQSKEAVAAALKRTLGESQPSPQELLEGSGGQTRAKQDEQNEDEEMLLKSLQEMAISGDFDPAKLDEASCKRFLKMAADGRLNSLVNPWKPWWIPPNKDEKDSKAIPLIPKLTDPSSWPNTSLPPSTPPLKILDFQDSSLPFLPIPSFVSLKCPAPSKLLRNNLVDLAYTYAFTQRVYNGEVEADVKGAGEVVFGVSDVLGKGLVHPKTRVALNSVLQNAARIQGVTREFCAWIIRDTILILAHKALLTRALCHLHNHVCRLIPKKKKCARKGAKKMTKKSNTGIRKARGDRAKKGLSEVKEKEGVDETVILSSLPKVATKEEIRAAQRLVSQPTQRAAGGDTGSLPALKADTGCHELGQREKLKKSLKRIEPTKAAARKLVFFCSWVQDSLEEEDVRSIAELVVDFWRRKQSSMENERAVAEALKNTELAPSAA
ncbi:hypothetical protein AAMO2058_001434600 [Amorphochlora amoebiformis]